MRPEEYTVFLVDDDVALQRSLKRLFAAEDLPVKAYSTAQEFLDAFNPASKGCLVLDVWLPGMSGKVNRKVICQLRPMMVAA